MTNATTASDNSRSANVSRHNRPTNTVTVRDVSTGHHAKITPGKSIVLFGVETNSVRGPYEYETTFRIGDQAEYNSWNLSFFGTIVSITAKTVTIVSYPGTSNERNHRLSLKKFEWRNRHFDLAKKSRENSEWMD